MAPPDQPRRLGVFLFYDPDGIVDDYIPHLLRDMRANLTDLVIMANGKLSDPGRRKLEEFSREIHVRPNQGFDVGAWREALVQHVGRERLKEYDELVLFNDSFFGPLYPFADIFNEMAGRGRDFWGLTVHGETRGTGLSPYGHRPRYLQTYFLVFGSRLLADPRFFEFWENQPVYQHFGELADRFAGVLTRHFADLGYTWGAFADTTDLESDPQRNFDHHTFNIYELIAHRRYPVIKRRSFQVSKETYLRFGSGTDLSNALDYIRAHYDYDLNLMFAHLLRRFDPGTLKDNLNLNFILPANSPTTPAPSPQRKALLVAHLFYPDLFAYSLSHLRHIPPKVDLLITTDTAAKQQELERMLAAEPARPGTVLHVESRGRDWGALLVGCKYQLEGYDYLGFIHDKKSLQKEYVTVGASFRDMLWHNLLASPGYIRDIIATFEANPWLGLLVPPPPLHGTYFKSGLDRWTICFDETVRLAQKLDLRARPNKQHQPIAVGSVFWCRTDALQPLFAVNWDYSDFPPEPLPNDGSLNHALERILPLVAQSQGYLTGWVLTDRYASTEIANLHYMVAATRDALKGTPGLHFATFATFRQSLTTLRRVLRLPGLYGTLNFFRNMIDAAARFSPNFVRRWRTRQLLRRAASQERP
ncbi:MAG: hypothetical protein GX803_02850 [Lentisphaerae bacterium]|jgi:rhamnosyltransferase|nr:hypothetical protein [Lentisphaerota bacterium]